MFLRLPLATEYCFESDCHGHDQLAKQKKTWSLSDWRCRNPKGPCKISKLKTGLWTLQVLVAFLHLLYGEVSVKILTSFSRTRTHINILASGAVTSGTELGWLRVFSHPELIQWGNLWCILQIHAGTTSRNFAPDLESHVKLVHFCFVLTAPLYVMSPQPLWHPTVIIMLHVCLHPGPRVSENKGQ